MSILTEDKSLRFGYTTGACAAAGVRAILLKEKGRPYDKVWLTALDGTRLLIPVKEVVCGKDGCQRAEVVKFSGDDPDITNGTSVFVELRSLPEGGETLFKAGEGIGIVTKPGLTLPVGEPAINYGLSVSRLGGAVQESNMKKIGAVVRRKLWRKLEEARGGK